MKCVLVIHRQLYWKMSVSGLLLGQPLLQATIQHDALMFGFSQCQGRLEAETGYRDVLQQVVATYLNQPG